MFCGTRLQESQVDVILIAMIPYATKSRKEAKIMYSFLFLQNSRSNMYKLLVPQQIIIFVIPYRLYHIL